LKCSRPGGRCWLHMVTRPGAAPRVAENRHQSYIFERRIAL
jgi:hypothetical protein